MQAIQINLRFIQENLPVFSFSIALLALIVTWRNFQNSKRVFLASNYPKIKAKLYLRNPHILPTYNVRNESDKISANDIRIEVGITSWLEFSVFRGRWVIYNLEKLERLKPLECFVPSNMSSTDLVQWLKERGYETEHSMSLKDQKILSSISEKKSYRVRLNVYYTSSAFSENRKVFKMSKKYKLNSCSNSQQTDWILVTFWWKWYLELQNSRHINTAKLNLCFFSLAYHFISGRSPIDPRDKFYWKLKPVE